MSSFSILVVEDDPNFLKVLGNLLQSAGHRVMAVGSAREAIAHLRQIAFDVIIMDWHMPEISGVELFVWIQNNCELMGCILISGSADQVMHEVAAGDRQQLALLGKPFAKEQLFDLIDQIGANILRRRRLAIMGARKP